MEKHTISPRSAFQLELEKLRNSLVAMGTLVEEAMSAAVRSLAERDLNLARRVAAGDDEIDRRQQEIEEYAWKLLALQQPMAGDLRTIGTALKIVTDLERMADHAVDIAKVTIRLADEPLIKPLVDIPRMAEIAQQMTREALTAYIHRDAEIAAHLEDTDHRVDELYNQVFRELLVLMMADPKCINQATQLLMVALYLERVADHATNIGEWVIYMISGERRDLNV
ncbi:MAG: phosphate signaling complex protein PhoU [Bacillota bacterium]